MSKLKKGILTFGIIIAIFGIIVGCVLGIVHLGRNRADPICFCISEIKKNENYNCELTYIYDELELIDEEVHSGCELYTYYVTTFTSGRKGEWYCFVEFKPTFITRLMFNGYTPEELVLIDCDLLVETIYS